MPKRDTSITPAIDDRSPSAQNYLATKRAELERKAIDLAPEALSTLKGVMKSKSKRVSAAAKVSAARTILEQAVGRPQVREAAEVQAGTVINIHIERFSVEAEGKTALPITLEAVAVETPAPLEIDGAEVE